MRSITSRLDQRARMIRVRNAVARMLPLSHGLLGELGHPAIVEVRAERMRSHVTFRTSRFNQTEVQPHFINPCCFGEDCIFWLVAQLREQGWDDLTEPWQEDWGWQASGQRDGRRYLLSVGLIPEDEPEWLVHIQERAPLLDRLRGRGKLLVLPRLAPALHRVLGAAPDINDVSWHYEDEFRNGDSVGAADPSTPRGPGGTA